MSEFNHELQHSCRTRIVAASIAVDPSQAADEKMS